MATLIRCKACSAQVSDEAPTCPHCGQPFRPPRAPRKQAGGCAIVFVIAGGFVLYALLSGGAPATPAAKADPRDALGYACQQFVKPTLNDPASADFEDNRKAVVVPDSHQPDTYTVIFNGRAKNGFGALMPAKFGCSIRIADGQYKLLSAAQL